MRVRCRKVLHPLRDISPAGLSRNHCRFLRPGEAMKSRISSGVMCLLLCVVALGPRAAFAEGDVNAELGQPTKADALAHLSKGNGFYKIGEFEAAIAEYKAGSLVEPAGVFQFNLGQAYRQQSNYEKAIWHYQRFIAMRQPQGELLKMVEGFIATMKAELEKAASRQEPTGPGTADMTAKPASTAVDTSLPEDDRRGWLTGRRKIALGVGAAGLVAVGAGIVFGVRAKGFEDDSDALCPMTACDQAAEANRLLERGQDNALYANIAYGVGAAAVVGAAVLWFTGAPSEGDTQVHALVEPNVLGAAVSGRF